MGKKNILILLFLFIGLGSSVGQIDETKTKIYQVGLNVGPLWTNIIHHQEEQAPIAISSVFSVQEILSFKLIKNKIGLRLGLGGQYIKQKMEDNTDIQSSILGRIGFEKQIEFTKRWECFYGLDLKLNLGKLKFSFEENPYKWNRVGLSNFFGMQYRLTPRLILQTEMSLQFSQTTTRNSIQFFINPFPIEPTGVGEKTVNRNIDIVLPNLLYLAFEF